MTETFWFLYGALWSWILTSSWHIYRQSCARPLPPGEHA